MTSCAGSWTCCLKAIWTPEEFEQRSKSQLIDKGLEKERRQRRRQVKLLLLGAGESGKSTFLKQMRIIHGYRFTAEELDEFRQIIYRNILLGMKVLIDARRVLNIPWGDCSLDKVAQNIFTFSSNNVIDWLAFSDYASGVYLLWQDKSIQQAFNRRSQFQLTDSVAYFFNNINRINSPDYSPSDKDILHARKATKTITEFMIPINSIPFLFIDVGGQRTQREKWFQCFEGVTCILFLASSSEFDQAIHEDRTTNRLMESLNIFETIVNNRNFSKLSIILFLNKTDLLIQKVRARQSNISHYFSDFKGNPHDEKDVQSFILQKFIEQRKPENRRPLFHHFTTAVDTENITVVFNSVKDIILQKNLEALMLQ